MVQTFLLFETITNEKTVKLMQHDIITSNITWHLGLVGSNNFGEYTFFSPFTLAPAMWGSESVTSLTAQYHTSSVHERCLRSDP